MVVSGLPMNRPDQTNNVFCTHGWGSKRESLQTPCSDVDACCSHALHWHWHWHWRIIDYGLFCLRWSSLHRRLLMAPAAHLNMWSSHGARLRDTVLHGPVLAACTFRHSGSFLWGWLVLRLHTSHDSIHYRCVEWPQMMDVTMFGLLGIIIFGMVAFWVYLVRTYGK
jgi:hypothetical protein